VELLQRAFSAHKVSQNIAVEIQGELKATSRCPLSLVNSSLEPGAHNADRKGERKRGEKKEEGTK